VLVFAFLSLVFSAAWGASPAIPCPFLIRDAATFPYPLFRNAPASQLKGVARVTGRLPSGLKGTLFRNGPGVFSRAGQFKNSLIDSDGFVRRFEFAAGQVRFDARMIETPKWRQEEAAGRFELPTWTTLGRSWLGNLAWKTHNQAGVHLLAQEGRLFALDEMQRAFEIDPQSLAAIGETPLDPTVPRRKYQVHYRIEGDRKHLLSFVPGHRSRFEIRTLDSHGSVLQTLALVPPRLAYVHDWAVTESNFVFILHPVFANTARFIASGLGLLPLSQTFDFRPEQGNLLWVVPRNDPAAARVYEASGGQVWHILNAYDLPSGGVIDFSSNPMKESFSGPDSRFGALAQGIAAVPTQNSSFVRRYQWDLEKSTLTESVLAQEANYDFPALPAHLFARQHRYGYFARQVKETAFFQGVTRVDYLRNETQTFEFAPHQFCMEPVYAADPHSPAEDGGWLLVEVFDSQLQTTRLAVLAAADVTAGPVAWVDLPWALPVSFHGVWLPRPQ
jgi:all-trans-8'-apo-beta-carotenal 15,15'-oxygenase